MPRIVHVHGFFDGQGKEQHGDDRRNGTEPAQADEVDVFLIACGKAAAGVRAEQDGADGKAHTEGCRFNR